MAITLQRNMRHFHDYVIVTSPEDEKTQWVGCSVPGVRVHVTDAHRRHGARFNKGLCMTEGFDVLGLDDWTCIIDADILLPDELPIYDLQPTKLYGCRRRVLEDPSKWSPDLDWRSLPISRDGGAIGFFQLWHASDPAVQGKHPLYDVSFGHAGGSDAYFLTHWEPQYRVVLPFDVLHIGKTDCNWFGTDQAGRDMMARFVHENGWRSAMAKHDPQAVARSPEVVHRVEVPGYPVSSFDLPFVRRAKTARERQNPPQ